MRLIFLTLLFCSTFLMGEPHLISVKKIWDLAPYNAFTDLIYYKGIFYCCFRESDSHAGGEDGQIRVITSSDGVTWTSLALLTLKGYDLRDPHLSKTPKGDLLINMGATLWQGENQTLNSAVCFSSDGTNFDSVQLLPYVGQWMWRVTWHKGHAYTAAYQFTDDSKGFYLTLMHSPDGTEYKTLKRFHLAKDPTETTLRFLEDGTMIALVRRNAGDGLIGTSPPPYENWVWADTNSILGGPNFLVLSNNAMWATSRYITENKKEKCILAEMSMQAYDPALILPSGGDCSYPGMVHRDGKLYISYYSSHEGKASIYFAVIKID